MINLNWNFNPSIFSNIMVSLPADFLFPSWTWSHGSWIYNYLCHQCLSPLMLWGRISIRARCTTLCDKVCQRLATGRWFSPGPPVSSINKPDRHDIAEILLKVALNTIKTTKKLDLIKTGEATSTNVIIFGLTRSGFKIAIYRNRGGHANHYPTDAVKSDIGYSSGWQ